MRRTAIAALILFTLANSAPAADYSAPIEADFILKEFKFATGETLSEVRMHYRTVGKPQRDNDGRVVNAVVILHGTGGQGGNFFPAVGAPDIFAGELFGKGQPLDAERFFIVLPDNLGHGKSSKPSDG